MAKESEREKIQFELDQLQNLENYASGLAYKVESSKLKEKLDGIEEEQRKNFARQSGGIRIKTKENALMTARWVE